MGKNKRGKDIICKKISYSLRIPKIDILKTNNIFHNFKTTTQRNYFEYDGIYKTEFVIFELNPGPRFAVRAQLDPSTLY
jgi:hypothetical protein